MAKDHARLRGVACLSVVCGPSGTKELIDLVAGFCSLLLEAWSPSFLACLYISRGRLGLHEGGLAGGLKTFHLDR